MYSGNTRDSPDSDGGAITAGPDPLDMNDGIPMHRAFDEPRSKEYLPLDELRWRLLAPPTEPLVLEQLDLTDRADQGPRTILAKGMSKVVQLIRQRKSRRA